MNQLTAAVTTGSPRTRPCQAKRWAATRPGGIVPIGESIGAVAIAISWIARFSESRAKPSVSATMSIDCMKPPPRNFSIGLFFATLGSLPKSIISWTTSRRSVGADVGELLGADVGDRAREAGDHEREALGDAAGMDAGAVERRAALSARRFDLARVDPLRVDPAERRHDVDAGPQDPDQDLRIRHQRAVDHAVGTEREQRVDVAGRADADRRAADEGPDILAFLRFAVDPTADELELRMVEHALDRGAAHAAGRPLDHLPGHRFRLSLREPPRDTSRSLRRSRSPMQPASRSR